VERETPSVFFHIKDTPSHFRIRKGIILPLEIFFCRADIAYAKKWRENLEIYLSDGETGKNFEIDQIREIEERRYSVLASELSPFPDEGEICLEFLSPLHFISAKSGNRTFLTREQFASLIEKRICKLFKIDITCGMGDDDFRLLPYYWHYKEILHDSVSNPGTVKYLSGCVGNLFIKGKWTAFLPWLLLSSELHAGINITYGMGYFRIHPESLPYFSVFFPDKKGILASIRDVIDNYDNALTAVASDNPSDFNEEKLSMELAGAIRNGTYEPMPSKAFFIAKNDGGGRLVEQFDFRDLIVQQYLLKTIKDNFELMFEESSIGFRKGMSREEAIHIVYEAISEGYKYVIESDIEDFFPSVDLNLMERLLDFYIPNKDNSIKEILKKFLRNGYILNGQTHLREKGLAQGSPLSPILANLFMDSFDEEVRNWNAKMIRYSDDFIILTRTREEAEQILARTEMFLSGIGLTLKKEKTDVKKISEGFQFLGIRFECGEAVIESELNFKKLKKPLYITEPSLFIAVRGDSLDILKDRQVIATVPIRRISEIISVEKTVISTSLIRKCAEYSIPITVTLNTGYYITTIKPDSKKYFEISYRHWQKFCSLSDSEMLLIAKEFAAGKIEGYISLFKQRYSSENNCFIGELETILARINDAFTIEEVRGIEGAAAKNVFSHLNCFIENKSFHIKNRDRKKPDRINSLLNFSYYLLFSRVNATVRAVGLNPYLGFLHSPMDNYESLVCDIEELFRAKIDRFIIRAINLKIITEGDFLETPKGMRLTSDAVKRYLDKYEAEMNRRPKRAALSLKEEIYAQVEIFKKWSIEEGALSFCKWRI
jgi:CRISPR-associated protein Cas1